MAKKKSDKKFIQGMHLKKGALRAELGVKGSGPIPASKLEKATHSKNPTERKRAILAETFRKMNRKKKGK